MPEINVTGHSVRKRLPDGTLGAWHPPGTWRDYMPNWYWVFSAWFHAVKNVFFRHPTVYKVDLWSTCVELQGRSRVLFASCMFHDRTTPRPTKVPVLFFPQEVPKWWEPLGNTTATVQGPPTFVSPYPVHLHLG